MNNPGSDYGERLKTTVIANSRGKELRWELQSSFGSIAAFINATFDNIDVDSIIIHMEWANDRVVENG